VKGKKMAGFLWVVAAVIVALFIWSKFLSGRTA